MSNITTFTLVLAMKNGEYDAAARAIGNQTALDAAALAISVNDLLTDGEREQFSNAIRRAVRAQQSIPEQRDRMHI